MLFRTISDEEPSEDHASIVQHGNARHFKPCVSLETTVSFAEEREGTTSDVAKDVLEERPLKNNS